GITPPAKDMLKEYIKSQNVNKKIDAANITIDHATATKDRITHFCNLNAIADSELDYKNIVKQNENEIIKYICSDNEIRHFLDKNIEIEFKIYKWYNKNNNIL